MKMMLKLLTDRICKNKAKSAAALKIIDETVQEFTLNAEQERALEL